MATIGIQEALGTFTKAVQSVVRINPEVTSFFRGFFVDDISVAKGTSFEIIRSGRKVYNDIGINDEPIITRMDKSTEKLFVPGFWDVAVQVDAYDSFERVFGQSDRIQERDFMSLVEEVARQTQLNINAIERKEEMMCSQIMNDGIVTLKNGDDIDYKRQAASIVPYNAAHDFSVDTVDPAVSLISDAEYLVEKGMVSPGEPINVAMGDTVLSDFLNNPFIKEKADIRRFNGVVEIAPGVTNVRGGTPQGEVKFGNYVFRIWGYSGRYDDPETSVSTKYLDPKKYVMLPTSTDFVMFYGGTKSWSGVGRNRFPGIRKAKRNFYEADDELRVSKLLGFRTRPLPIPREVDRIVTRQTVSP